MADLGKVVITHKGDYNPTATYEFLDGVLHNGSTYLAKRTVTGVEPAQGDDWQLMAQGLEISNTIDPQTLGDTKQLKDNMGNNIAPVTKTSAVYDSNGLNIDSKFNNINSNIFDNLPVVTNANNSPLGYSKISGGDANNPFAFWATIVTCRGASGYYQQWAYPWAIGVNKVAYRVRDGGTWGAWVHINDIVNSDTINDPNKVPSSAVTYGLAQKIAQWHTHHGIYDFAGNDHIDINIGNINIATPIFASNADKSTGNPFVTGTTVPSAGILRVYISTTWPGGLRLSIFWHS